MIKNRINVKMMRCKMETELIRLFLALYSNPARLQAMAILAGETAPDYIRQLAQAQPEDWEEALKLAATTMMQDDQDDAARDAEAALDAEEGEA